MGKTNHAEDVWQMAMAVHSPLLVSYHMQPNNFKVRRELHGVNWFHSDHSPRVDFAHDLHFQGLVVLQWRPHMQFRTEMEKDNWNIVKVMEYTTLNP